MKFYILPPSDSLSHVLERTKRNEKEALDPGEGSDQQ